MPGLFGLNTIEVVKEFLTFMESKLTMYIKVLILKFSLTFSFFESIYNVPRSETNEIKSNSFEKSAARN